MAETYQLDDEGIAAMVHFEGNVLHVYLDQAGKETIGIGHLCSAAELTTGRFPGGVQAFRDSQGRWAINADQSRAIFRFDTGRFASDLTNLYKGPRPLTANEADAIILWDFNTGGLFNSGVLAALNEGRFADVPTQMLRWNHIRDRLTGHLVEDAGLTARRRAEISIFVNGYDHPETDQELRQAATEAYGRQFTPAELLSGSDFAAGSPLPDDDVPPTDRNS